MRTSIALAALGLCVLGCDSPTATTSAVNRPLFDAQGNGVMHQVSVGSSDIVPPGTDANFSLVAIQHGDGSVSGQWQDSFGKDAPGVGVHVAIDCVNVVGNEAWVSGVATDKTFAGQPVITRVAAPRSEEHTSELQSPCNLVCRLLLEKKKKILRRNYRTINM